MWIGRTRHTFLALLLSLSTGSLVPEEIKAANGDQLPLPQKDSTVTADDMDPVTKYLLDDALAQGRITKQKYAALIRDYEEQAYTRQPSFKLWYNRGFHLNTNDNSFLLTIRGRLDTQYLDRYNNSAWSNPGDAKNFPELVGVFGDYRANRMESQSQTVSLRRARLYFMGHIFDPDMLKYFIQLRMDSSSDPSQTPGTVQLFDYYVMNTKIPWAHFQLGQYKVWFSRPQINSTASMQFAERALVQDAFPANGLDRRDIGLTITNDDEIYPLNYYFGVFGGVGPNNTSLFTFDSEQITQGCPGGQNSTPIPPGAASCTDPLANPTGFPPLQRNLNADTHRNINRLMFTARLNWNVMGRPGYGEGDIAYSKTPQLAIGGGYSYNPRINTSTNNAFIGEDLANLRIRQQMAAIGAGRELGWGVVDFSTWTADGIFKYRGFSLQGEFYFKNINRHDKNPPCLQFQQNNPNVIPPEPQAGFPFDCASLTPGGPFPPNTIGNSTGWSVQAGYYLIPRYLEVAGRYAYWDPDTHVGGDLIKETDFSLNWFLNGTYDHSIQITYSNIAIGTGGYAIGRSNPLPAVVPGSSGTPQFPNGPVPVDAVGGTLVENALRIQYQVFF